MRGLVWFVVTLIHRLWVVRQRQVAVSVVAVALLIRLLHSLIQLPLLDILLQPPSPDPDPLYGRVASLIPIHPKSKPISYPNTSPSLVTSYSVYCSSIIYRLAKKDY